MGEVRSMTGFGTGEAAAGDHKVTVEVRSVNGRFLDLQLRLARPLLPLETALREAISGKVGRGSVTVSASVAEAETAAQNSGDRWKRLAKELRDIQEAAGIVGEIELADLLHYAQIHSDVESADPAADELKPALLEALTGALAQHDAFRLHEGENLRRDLLARIGRIEGWLGQIPPLAVQHLKTCHDDLSRRIQELMGDYPSDPARIAQEVAHLADKLDIDEEMTRFASHNGQFRACLEQGGAVGKKLGFILQEMLREANTTGSKCQDAEIASLVISIKDEIESLKEQIANLE